MPTSWQGEANHDDMVLKQHDTIPTKIDENWWRYGGELVTK